MNLTWRPHIGYIASKISKIVGTFARLRHHVPLNILLQIYRSLIFPYTLYGIPVWGQAAQRDLKKIVTLQKRALRLILFSNKRCYSISLFFASNILPVDMVYSETVSTMMHDVFLIQYLRIFVSFLFIHLMCMLIVHVSLRQGNFIFTEESRLGLKLKSFSAFGARL